MIYADSSVLVARFDPKELLHGKAGRALSKAEAEDEVAVDTVIVSETYIALRRRGSAVAEAAIESILKDYRYAEVPKRVVAAALPGAAAVGWGDAAIEAHVRFDRARLLTCDREMAQRLGAQAVLVE